MRRFLDQLYRLSGGVAAAFLLAICAVVMVQVAANALDNLMRVVTGEPLGLVVPSYAEFTGFFLVAASFLALAYALRAGSHIRVVLVIRGLPPGPRRMIEIWCTAVGAVFSAYFTWHTILMVFDSYRFNDVSPGIIPMPIWIPQVSMAVGLVVLTVALIDEFVTVVRGDVPAYAKGDAGELAEVSPESGE